MIKTAILGGAFDPLTNGHLEIAESVISQTDIQEVWFMPCLRHNFNKQMVDFSVRMEMCEAALSSMENIKVSDFESRFPAAKGTYDLVRYLKHDYQDREFYLIIGMDNALTIKHWYNSQELINEINIIVVPRHGYTPPENAWFTRKPHVYLEGEIMEISSTYIREHINDWSEKDAAAFMPVSVFNIIQEKGLYGKNRGRKISQR